MKKLIAFSVIFALLTGAVIAQEFSGWAQVGILNLLGFDGEDLVAQGFSGGDEGRRRLDMRMGMNFDNGVAGINLTLRNRHDGTYDDFAAEGVLPRSAVYFDLGSGWWRPVENVLLTIGGKRFNRRLDEHFIWWDYESDGNARDWFFEANGWGSHGSVGTPPVAVNNARSTNNWFAVEIEDISDMVTLKFSFLNQAVGVQTFEEQYIDTLVAQAVINLGDMGVAALTFDNWRQLIVADYQGTISDVAIKGAFGFYFDDERGLTDAAGDQMWGLGLQANTTISDIGLMARFNTNMFKMMDFLVEAKYDAITAGVGFLTADLEEFADSTIIAAYASYGFDYDGIEMFDVNIAPRIDFAFDLGRDDDAIYVGWEIPISLRKSIDGFSFYAGIKLGGTLVDFGGVDVDAFTFTVPVTFRYTW